MLFLALPGIAWLLVYSAPFVTAQSLPSIPTPEEIAAQAQKGTLEVGTRASLLPQVYVHSTTVTPGADGVLSGTFVMENKEESSVSGITYELLLLSPDMVNLYDRTYGDSTETLSPNESKTINLNYIPPKVPAGEYLLRLQVSTTNGRELGWDDVSVSLTGTSYWAMLSADHIAVDSIDPITGVAGATWHPFDGVNIEAGGKFEVVATIVNDSQESLSVAPEIAVKRDFDTSAKPSVSLETPISIAPGEQRTVLIPLVAETTPGPYEVAVILKDQAGTAASTTAEYRYVVRGASASVVSQIISAFSTRAGQSVEVDFSVAGSADRETPLTGTIDIALVGNDIVYGSTQDSIDFDDPSAAVGKAYIVLDRSICGEFALRTTLKNSSGSVLNSYEVPYSTTPCMTNQVHTSNSNWLTIVAALITMVVLIGILMFFIITLNNVSKGNKSTRGKSSRISMLLIIGIVVAAGLALSLSMNSIPARANGIQWTSESSDLVTIVGLWINAPQHNGSSNPDRINYQARLQWYVCGNRATDATLYAYTLDDGGFVSNPNGHSWTLQGQATRYIARTGDRVRYDVDLNKTISLPSNYRHNTTTLWTYAIARRFKDGGGTRNTVRQDLTWVNLRRPSPSPSPSPSLSPSPRPSPSPSPSPSPRPSPSPSPSSSPSPTPIVNNKPVAEAGVQINGGVATSTATVIRGQSVQVQLTANSDVTGDGISSHDPDGWNHPTLGMISGGICAWNADLDQGPPFNFDQIIPNPASPNSCNIDLGTLTFNDPPGTYTYNVFRLTDATGTTSDISTIRVTVTAPTVAPSASPVASPSGSPGPQPSPAPACSDGIDNDGDGRVDCIDPGCWTNINNPNSCDPNDNSEPHTPLFNPGPFQETD